MQPLQFFVSFVIPLVLNTIQANIRRTKRKSQITRFSTKTKEPLIFQIAQTVQVELEVLFGIR